MIGPGYGDNEVTFWKQRQVVESTGGEIPWPSVEGPNPLGSGDDTLSVGLKTIFNTTHMPGAAVAYVGQDCSALKGLRVTVIKDLSCHVDGKLGNRLCRSLNKSALDLWPNLIQQKIISVAYWVLCSDGDRNKIKVEMRRREWKFNPHAVGRTLQYILSQIK